MGRILAWPIRAAINLVGEAAKANGLAFQNVADVIEQADEFTIGWGVSSKKQEPTLISPSPRSRVHN